jgi:hypothetical protein
MTMTRETKVGLVVCLSFLCLVGVVLGTKLRGDARDDEQVVKEEIIPDPLPAGSAGHESSPAARIPTQTPDHKGPPLMRTGAVQDAQPLPPPPSLTAPRNDRMETAPLPPPVSDIAVPISAGQQNSDDSATLSLNGIPAPDAPALTNTNSDLTSAGQPAEGLLVPTPFGMIRFPSSNGQSNHSPGPGDVPPPPSAVNADAKQQSAPAQSDQAAETQPKQDDPSIRQGEIDGLPPPPIARGANPTDVAPKPGPANPGGAAALRPGDIELTVPPPPPANSSTRPAAELLPPIPPPDATRSIAANAQPDRAQGKPADAPSSADARTGATGQTIVPVSANDNPRRIGTTPTAVTPPIAVPSPGSAPPARPAASIVPQVDSYDEETYRLKPGDTFEKISAAHYNTDRYAKALERWNVLHPQASDSLRAEPPQLNAGQAIYLPPTFMLEKRYGSLIPGYKKQPEIRPDQTPRTVNAAPRTGSAEQTIPDHRWYQVGPRGETMREIARNTLGKAERWTEISKLNPGIDPAYAIPAGLAIKVPADAKNPTVPAQPDRQRQP